MQVIFNGKTLDGLSPKLERELSSGRPRERTEGVVLTASQALAATTRGLRIVYAFLGGLSALIMIPVLIGTALYEPRDLIFLAPLCLVLTAAVAALMRFMYRRNSTRLGQRAEEQSPRMPAAGSVVLVEASGLSVGTDRYPWSTLTVRALVVSTTSAGDSSMNVIERLELEGGGQPIVLDAPLIQNGAAVVYDTWRRCRLKDQAPSR